MPPRDPDNPRFLLSFRFFDRTHFGHVSDYLFARRGRPRPRTDHGQTRAEPRCRITLFRSSNLRICVASSMKVPSLGAIAPAASSHLFVRDHVSNYLFARRGRPRPRTDHGQNQTLAR
jgi:hypothetical protein